MSRVILGDVANERRETCKGSKDGYPIVGLEHLTPGEITLTAWDEGKENTFSKSFRKGDILFGRRRAYLKKAAVAPFDGICSGDITVIKAQPKRILPELLPFIIQNDALFEFAVGKSAGSLSPRVKWENLKNYEIELPDMEKQRELAKILWAIDKTRKTYQKLMQKTDELVKSRFIEMFGDPVTNPMGWEVKPLGDVFKIIDGDRGEHYPKGTDFYKVGYCAFLNTGNVTINGFEFSNVHFITEDKDKQLRKGRFERHDIVVTTRGTVGNIALYTQNVPYEVMRINSGMVLLREYSKIINPEYFIFLVRVFSIFRPYLSGSAQPQLPITNMKKIPIQIPQLDLQNRFADFVRQVDKSKFELKKALADLEATCKRIISENLG
ncbi:restriction endonuclease subunit S [Paenibacillus lautus]|uniref:restriction endonuclease subunit S n=1 Tax=Paenibacillus lautus TaxID=1401 RepID=UPI002DBE3A0F|nr:restriction endonuclease subunit S [Paenibacillus lautus]MEC0206610.1 restriction endonuclease subunit S [Paenibacillus lautus]